MLDGLHAETARPEGRDHTPKFQLIQDRGLSTCMKPDAVVVSGSTAAPSSSSSSATLSVAASAFFLIMCPLVFLLVLLLPAS